MSTEREQVERDIALAFEGQGAAWPGGDHLAYVASLAVERRLTAVKAVARAEELASLAEFRGGDWLAEVKMRLAHVTRSTL